jgi:hypothetical protein
VRLTRGVGESEGEVRGSRTIPYRTVRTFVEPVYEVCVCPVYAVGVLREQGGETPAQEGGEDSSDCHQLVDLSAVWERGR